MPSQFCINIPKNIIHYMLQSCKYTN